MKNIKKISAALLATGLLASTSIQVFANDTEKVDTSTFETVNLQDALKNVKNETTSLEDLQMIVANIPVGLTANNIFALSTNIEKISNPQAKSALYKNLENALAKYEEKNKPEESTETPVEDETEVEKNIPETDETEEVKDVPKSQENESEKTEKQVGHELKKSEREAAKEAQKATKLVEKQERTAAQQAKKEEHKAAQLVKKQERKAAQQVKKDEHKATQQVKKEERKTSDKMKKDDQKAKHQEKKEEKDKK